MDEARSLQYSIEVKTDIAKAEQDIQSLISQCGKLRTEAAGGIDIHANVDTGQAAENIRDLTGNIGALHSNTNDLDIDIDADTTRANERIRDLTGSIGNLGENAGDIDIDADTSGARRNIRDLTGDIGDLNHDANSLGSAFRKSFLTGIDSGSSFSSSLRSGIGGAFTYVKNKVTDFKDNVVTKIKSAANSIVSGAQSIGHGFAHPIETIKSGLGGAIDHAKSKFINFVRGAKDASDAADDVGDSSAGARADIERLGDAAEKSGGKFEKLGSLLKSLGTVAAVGLTTATVAVGGFAASSVNTGKAFDSSMSQVAATMGYSVAELNDSTSEASQNFSQLRAFAMEMGANTAFSASQAADALNYMALAGYDAETSMTMLPNVLNLAAAGGIGLADASDMVTDAQSALGLTLDETSELVDKMAAASSKSNTSVKQLGDAILTVGGTAKNLAGGTTELSTMLGVLADNGIKGAEGGTALRNMILSLSAPTDIAAKQLKALGVDAFDAEGNLRPLNETFGDLKGALSTMTQEKQTQALNEIFNKVDLKAVNAMLGTSAERFEELETAIDGAWVSMGSLSTSLSDVGLDLTSMQDNLSKLGIGDEAFSDLLKTSGGNAEQFANSLLEAADAGVSQEDIINALGGDLENLQVAFDNTTGAAQAMADTQLDNLAGDITLFQSALEGAQIIISDELTPSLRTFTQFGTDALTKLSNAFQEGGFTGAMNALGGILSDGLRMIIGMLPTAINAGMQLLGAFGQGLLDNMPMLIDAAIQIVTTLGNGILNSLPKIAGAAVQMIASLASGIRDMLPELIPTVIETITLIASTLLENLPLLIDAGMQLISGLAEGIIGAIPILIEQLPLLMNQIVGFLSESLPAILEQGALILTSLAEGLIGAIPMLVETLPTLISSIVGFVTENLPMIAELGIQILLSLATGMINALPELIGQLPVIISSIVGGLSESIPRIVETGVNLLTRFAEGILSAIPLLLSQLPAIGTAILDVLSGIPGMVIDVGKNIVKGLWSGVSSMVDWAIGQIKGFGSSIVNALKDFLGIHSPSTVFAEIGDNMALGLGAGFTSEMGAVEKDIKGTIPTNLDGPKIDIPNPNVENYDLPNIPAAICHVNPLVEDVQLPNVPDIDYNVRAKVQDYNLPASMKSIPYSVNPVVAGVESLSVPDVSHSLNPVTENLGEIGSTVEDMTCKVSPIMEDIKIPPVSDLTYKVSPLVQDFHPPGYEKYAEMEDGDGNAPNVEDSADGTPEPNGSRSAGGNGSLGFTFAPVVTIPITVEGNADRETLEKLRAQLEADFTAKMKELFQEFREEELQQAALKNQYAF